MKGSLAALWLVLAPQAALAARRPFIVTYDTATLAEGDAEVETWLDLIVNREAADLWRWWVGARWSPYEGMEVAAVTVLQQAYNMPGYAQLGSTVQLWAELLQGRWRVFQRPFGALALELDLRIPLASGLPWQLSPSLSWTTRISRVSLAAQLGYAAGVPGPGASAPYHWIVWSAGVTVDALKGEATPLLQVGVEAFGEGVIVGQNDLNGLRHSTMNVGPVVSIAKGRLWLSLGCLLPALFYSPLPFVRGVIGLVL
jgi:hypothetical protein